MGWLVGLERMTAIFCACPCVCVCVPVKGVINFTSGLRSFGPIDLWVCIIFTLDGSPVRLRANHVLIIIDVRASFSDSNWIDISSQNAHECEWKRWNP